MTTKSDQVKIEKGFVILKRIILAIFTIYYVYFLLATLNILPRLFNEYRKKPGTIFILTVDPLQNFAVWFILSLVILAIIGGLYYFFHRKKVKSNDSQRIKFFDLISSIFLYALIFKIADLIIISILNLVGFI